MNTDREFDNCPRCYARIQEYEDWRDHDDCPYVNCDRTDCVAPRNMEENWEASAKHWRFHPYLHGCSHGQ